MFVMILKEERDFKDFMRLLVLLLLPLMTYSMDKAYEQARKDAQQQISVAYSDMYFSIALYNKLNTQR